MWLKCHINLKQELELPTTTIVTCHNHWNGYLRKGQKTKPKRQNQTRNGKASQLKSKKWSAAKSQQSKSKPTIKNT
ncbi:hypothetical protein Tco_0225495 [Tanacetum coccineum]